MPKTSRSITTQVALVLASAALAGGAYGQTKADKVPVNPLKNAYFGQLHMHTGMSFDAFLTGTRLYPENAYRLARGETIQFEGRPIVPDTPLHFLGVSDHSEYLGQMRVAAEPDGPLGQTDFGKTFKDSS